MSKIISVFVILGLLILIFKSYNDSNDLLQNYILTEGTVLSFTIAAKGSSNTVKYEYKVDGIFYEGYNAYPEISRSQGSIIVGKKFPVAFLKKDNKISHILISTKDFRNFSIPFPDSLLWIKNIEIK
ncbi:hypothetical protein LX64_01845 [Chitinophaga skermanii]|uniref:Uncharacterized protein n=1 Tax=Chitinophaga skermanii TaxID=331697 RepID=A0A327QRY2_9BACT|nr:hypothetical protein [Chitinophaga skermanii]RAJ06718.1 hypothetical protein LX64_01845 [Chitinophaga skermanii]